MFTPITNSSRNWHSARVVLKPEFTESCMFWTPVWQCKTTNVLLGHPVLYERADVDMWVAMFAMFMSGWLLTDGGQSRAAAIIDHCNVDTWLCVGAGVSSSLLCVIARKSNTTYNHINDSIKLILIVAKSHGSMVSGYRVDHGREERGSCLLQ